MKRNMPSVRTSALILLVVLCWRIIGAPVTRQDWINLHTPMWQARTLLPQRMARVFTLWLNGSVPEAQAEQMAQDGQMISVYLTQEKRLVPMTLEGYVCGVVAAEMPARYHLEALKAQAVAARTRVLSQMEKGGCSLHPGADICTDSAHCQGYATMDECREKWKDGYEAYRDRILQAQRETRGQVLTYGGELITVFYHAMSGGRTEDAATVFAQSFPYLVSVESAGEESAGGFWTETKLSFDEIAQRLGMGITPQDVQRSLSIGGYTPSGRVSAMQIGEETMDASAFRQALGLRSTWFSITADQEGVTFLQRGYGHGVGMSQTGANSMAAQGSGYTDILAHYYRGTTLESR